VLFRSPSLANIYLHEIDEQITEIHNIRLIRYADDFVILCKTKEDAKETMKQVIDLFTGLKLRLNKKKTRIVNVNREYIMFLGFKLKRVAGKVMITPRMKSIKNFKRKIKQTTRRKQPVKPKEMIWRLNKTIQGWGNYYCIGTVKKLFERLDKWIRTRVRTFIEKKKSSYANRRIPTYILQSEYKLTSLTTLINLHSL
jgi:RNA-directed DNA polymerase